MFVTRLISGIILVILAILLIGTGGDVLLVSTCILSLIGIFELYRVLKIHNKLLGFISYIMTVFYYVNLKCGLIKDSLVYITIFLLCLLLAYVFAYPKYSSDEVFGALFGFFYVTVMLSYIYQTRMIPVRGKYIVWMIFLCAWGSDTCAYCVGRLFGKHKMAPVLSPKKSIEGAVGGVIGAAALNAIFAYIFKSQLGMNMQEIGIIALIGAAGALVSMVGDLAASAIKRNYDIKDYGRIIPGHGGILDRFDSIIITAPIVFYLARLVLAG